MTHREEIIGDCRLILGDCRDILPTLGPVDAVITDPPYSVSVKGSKQGKGASGTRSLDFFAGDDDWAAMTALVTEALTASVASEPKTFVAWCGHRQIGPLTAMLESVGYSTRLIFWRKRCPPPSTPDAAFTSAVEQAVYAYRSGRVWRGGQTAANIFDADSYRFGQPGKVDHPTQKPLSLIEWNTDCLTLPGQTVLDPFMGSGTTGVACARSDRSFIGIELEQRFFDIACRRIEEAYKQPRLFAEPVAKPVQTSLLDDAA
jgi:DNA modification methylase